MLFRGQPVLVALSCELRDPGSFATLTVGDVPLVVVRQPDGSVKGFVNVCRHRGSTLLTAPCGDGLRSIRCPYHAWTYGLDGCLKAFPGAEAGFDDVDKATHGLIEVPVTEQYGLVFAVAIRRPARSRWPTRCTAPRSRSPTSRWASTPTSSLVSTSGR